MLPHAPTGSQHAAGPKDAPLKSLFPPRAARAQAGTLRPYIHSDVCKHLDWLRLLRLLLDDDRKHASALPWEVSCLTGPKPPHSSQRVLYSKPHAAIRPQNCWATNSLREVAGQHARFIKATVIPAGLRCQGAEIAACFRGTPSSRVAIVGCGLAGLSTAAELLDQGFEVDIYEARPFIGGKVASYKDRDGNHIEVGTFFFVLFLLGGTGSDLAVMLSWVNN